MPNEWRFNPRLEDRMDHPPYTLARWLVHPGNEETFVAAWQELGTVFLSLPQPTSWGLLLRSADQPNLFYSFGPWPSLDAIRAMREEPRAREALGRLAALCDEATPGVFVAVAAGGQPPAGV